MIFAHISIIADKHWRFCLTILLLLCWSNSCVAQYVVTYPSPESSDDQRTSYPVALLKLCESKSGDKFTLRPSPFRSQQNRSLRQLSLGLGIDIAWALTNAERESNLLPVRIPIDKGLIGWRLLLVRSQDKNLFSNIHSSSALGALLAVQGHDWPDVDVLKANNMKVTTGTTYEGLFKMLSVGHGHYFPRAATEIWPEANTHADLGIEVEPSLVIHYPSALYFFVSRKNQELATILEACLKESIADGSFDELFRRYYGPALAKSELEKRTVIELQNPTLPEATPINNPNYWYSTGTKR